VTDIPRSSIARTAKLVGLPLGHAGRVAMGVGKRVGGRPAEAVAAYREALAKNDGETAARAQFLIGKIQAVAQKWFDRDGKLVMTKVVGGILATK